MYFFAVHVVCHSSYKEKGNVFTHHIHYCVLSIFTVSMPVACRHCTRSIWTRTKAARYCVHRVQLQRLVCFVHILHLRALHGYWFYILCFKVRLMFKMLNFTHVICFLLFSLFMQTVTVVTSWKIYIYYLIETAES